MAIVKPQIEYKGQGIEIISMESPKGKVYKYRIKYFPKKQNCEKCVFKMLQSPMEFTTQEEAKEKAKARIDLEFEEDNWRMPREKIFKNYKHEE